MAVRVLGTGLRHTCHEPRQLSTVSGRPVSKGTTDLYCGGSGCSFALTGFKYCSLEVADLNGNASVHTVRCLNLPVTVTTIISTINTVSRLGVRTAKLQVQHRRIAMSRGDSLFRLSVAWHSRADTQETDSIIEDPLFRPLHPGEMKR